MGTLALRAIPTTMEVVLSTAPLSILVHTLVNGHWYLGTYVPSTLVGIGRYLGRSGTYLRHIDFDPDGSCSALCCAALCTFTL